jgi:hypothetical protein
MANPLTELFDVITHLVRTHSNWNVDLSQEEALAKVVAAKAAALEPDVEKTVSDASTVVGDVETDVKDVETAVKGK